MYKKLKRKIFLILQAFTVVSVVFLFGCNEEKLTAKQILENSINAHGGRKKWERIRSISYDKQTTFFNKEGEIEKIKDETIKHSWDPSFTEIKRIEGGKFVIAKKDYKGITLFENNILQKKPNLLEQANKELDAALYVFWQPYKLYDKNTLLKYIGNINLLDSISVYAIEIAYLDQKSQDKWTYFFDVNNFLLRASQVNHKNRVSLIINENLESKTGLFLNKRRKSYFLDSLGRIKYLRADYNYKINSLEVF